METPNQLFESMSPAERRVAIAKDVIVQLKSEQLLAATHEYVVPSLSKFWKPDPQQQLCDVYNQTVCRVCARGALLVAAVKRFNNITVGQFGEPTVYAFTPEAFRNHERQFFDDNQIIEIETAFERCGRGSLSAVLFGDKYEDTTERMLAIMENIIRNNGVFNPSGDIETK